MRWGEVESTTFVVYAMFGAGDTDRMQCLLTSFHCKRIPKSKR